MRLIYYLTTIFLLFTGCGNIAYAQTSEWINMSSGNRAFKKGDFVRSEKEYKKALERDSSDVTARYNLGNAKFAQGNFDEALQNYNHIIKYNANDDKAVTSNVFHNVGVIQQSQANDQNDLMTQQKLLRNAIENYKQALRLNPNAEKSRYNMVLCQKQLKDLPKDPNGGDDKKNKNQEKKNEEDKKEKKSQSDPQEKQQESKENKNQNKNDKQTQNLLNYIRQREQQTKDKINRQENRNNRSKVKNW